MFTFKSIPQTFNLMHYIKSYKQFLQLILLCVYWDEIMWSWDALGCDCCLALVSAACSLFTSPQGSNSKSVDVASWYIDAMVSFTHQWWPSSERYPEVSQGITQIMENLKNLLNPPFRKFAASCAVTRS